MSTPTGLLSQLLRINASAIGIAIGATAFVAAAVVLPVFRARAEQEGLVNRLDSARARFEHASEMVTDHQKRLKIAASEVTNARVQTEPVTSLNQRLSRFAALSKEHGLVLEAVNPGEVIVTAKSSSIPIKISGECDAQSCQAFLRALKAEYPDTAVTALSLFRRQTDAQAQSPDSGSSSPLATPTSRFSMDLMWHAAPSAQPDPKLPKAP